MSDPAKRGEKLAGDDPDEATSVTRAASRTITHPLQVKEGKREHMSHSDSSGREGSSSVTKGREASPSSITDDHPLQSSNSSIRNFFYPSTRPSSLQETDIPIPQGGHRNTMTGQSNERMKKNPNGSFHGMREDDPFEDEHDASYVPNTPRAVGSLSSQQSSLPSQVQAAEDTVAASLESQERQDKAFVENFWTAYDEILILSLFTQVGILCRLGAAYWFRYFDNVFRSDSALFAQLPLNCLSCFVMGLLCSGESLMEIIATRFTPPRLQRDLHRDSMNQSQEETHEADCEEEDSTYYQEEMTEMRVNGTERGGWIQRRRRRRRLKRNRNGRSNSLTQTPNTKATDVYTELREVQLLAWERRIRASVCLLLFPVKKEDVDIVETYFSDGYERDRSSEYRNSNITAGDEHRDGRLSLISSHDTGFSNVSDEMPTEGGFDDLIFDEEIDHSPRNQTAIQPHRNSTMRTGTHVQQEHDTTTSQVIEERIDPGANTIDQGRAYARGNVHISSRQYGQLQGGNIVDYGTQENPDLDQIISNVATGVSNNISMISRVNLANGWDVGTSPQEKSEDLTLGLRDGLCGALSSFSSWISSMVNLLRVGQIDKAFVGLMLGIQLPIISYRFGQYVSVYIFVWRCRREKGQDEKRGYGIQLHTTDEENLSHDIPNSLDRQSSVDSADESQRTRRTKGRRTVHDEENDVPSIRAIFTALFIMCLVAQLTSLSFFNKPEDRLLALSLLFSPLGVLARWRMMKFNAWRPNFPLGTFACNVTACALSGSLGSLLAGNPGPRERIALVSVVAGFGGTLSSVARFIVEILSLMDPILFRLDGLYYAIISVCSGLLVSFLFAASVDWADSIE